VINTEYTPANRTQAAARSSWDFAFPSGLYVLHEEGRD